LTWRTKFEREILDRHELDYVMLVDHTTEAFYDLAAFVRRIINPTLVAIAGSVGKTSTTEMVACILSEQAATMKCNVWNTHVAMRLG
jgi:UDP-N-acetylmuramyl pentapeptide synthase